jgi:proteasome accessory factor C
VSRATAADRVERILSVLPWIVAEQGADVDEVCARFDLSRKELEADLDLLFYEVGIHPFTPDARVDVQIDGNKIYVHHGDYFRRPLRLTHEEALTLVAAGRAALEHPDVDLALDPAVAKLTAALGPGADEAVDVRLGQADPVVLAAVQRAVADRRRIHIEYYSFGRDERTSRDVDPRRLVADGGHWYLLGWCHRAGDLRWFRADRIATVTVTDVEAGPGDGDDRDGPDLDAADRTVELVLGPEQAWVADTYPTVEVTELDDGRQRVVVRVAAEPWLERLLLRLGPAVEARDAETGESLSPLAAAAAARVLRRYGR